MRVLLVEGDSRHASSLIVALGGRGHFPIWCRRGADATTLLFAADLVLVNLAIGDIDGIHLVQRIRAESATVPIIAISTRRDALSAERALRAGADDCLPESIRTGELLARMETVARRVGTARTGEQRLRVSDIEINVGARTVHASGEIVELTPIEYEMLLVLARNAGAAVSRASIMEAVWGETNPQISRSMDVHMVSLRAKLNRPGLLRTHWGFGYRLG